MVLHRFRLASRSALATIVTLASFPVYGQDPLPPTPPAPSGITAPTSPPTTSAPVVTQKITAANTQIELTVNGSRILTMDSEIPRAQVGNPELLAFTVISGNEVQIHAK